MPGATVRPLATTAHRQFSSPSQIIGRHLPIMIDVVSSPTWETSRDAGSHHATVSSAKPPIADHPSHHCRSSSPNATYCQHDRLDSHHRCSAHRHHFLPVPSSEQSFPSPSLVIKKGARTSEIAPVTTFSITVNISTTLRRRWGQVLAWFQFESINGGSDLKDRSNGLGMLLGWRSLVMFQGTIKNTRSDLRPNLMVHIVDN